MTEANNLLQAATATATWRRVSELADLVEIYNTGVQVCAWQRQINPAIEHYLSGLHQTRELQAMEVLPPNTRPRIAALEEELGKVALIDDLSFLQKIMFDLLGCDELGMRIARIGHAMCPGWHFDRVGVRLVCTYQGPGSQWLDDQAIDRSNLSSHHSSKDRVIQAATGEVVLFKGTLWQGNEALGAVHRSPELKSNSKLRTLISLDTLWHE